MSYDVCITRAEHSWENEGREIPLDDWLRVVSEDPGLQLRPDAGQGAAAWTAHPDGREVLFHLSHGNVVASGPDEPVIDKLVELAEALGGRAQGDDGEIYTSSNEWRWPEEEGEGAAPPSGLRGLAAAVREAVRTARDVVMGALAPKPFPVGARVRDPLLGKGEVIGYEYGPLHMIVVKLDDGRVVRRGVLLDGEYAAGLEAVEEE